MNQDQDGRFEQELKRMAQDYHRPPDTPRDEMWARIAAERAHRREVAKVVPLRRWVPWSAGGVAAAAVLVLGILIGRSTGKTAGPSSLAARPDSIAYRIAAAPYLTRTEALLTSFRNESRNGKKVDTEFVAQAQDLLVTTRLMLNSPAASDPRLASLLQDLETMLVQIAQLPAGNDRNDVDIINEGLDQRSVMLRLRAISPAPGANARGAL